MLQTKVSSGGEEIGDRVVVMFHAHPHCSHSSTPSPSPLPVAVDFKVRLRVENMSNHRHHLIQALNHAATATTPSQLHRQASLFQRIEASAILIFLFSLSTYPTHYFLISSRGLLLGGGSIAMTTPPDGRTTTAGSWRRRGGTRLSTLLLLVLLLHIGCPSAKSERGGDSSY